MNDHLLGGRYRLSGRIAVGGMGEVWRGTDELLDRAVAVKLLSAGHATDEAFRARFRAEARYAASLSHPNIAQVFDYGETSGPEEAPPGLPSSGAYLIMELVQGEPLSAVIARQERLSAGDTLRIVSQAADALAAAHEAGIVHRDIKPGNLLVTDDGTTKITDFGIARAMWAAQASHLTQTGMVMGTASYVSPEQATGGTVTSASDIYSLGVVAYECLTGEPPFTAETPVAIAVAHMHRPVPPLPDDVPAPVAELVTQMLAKPPEDRPQSARWVADRARQLRSALPNTASGLPPEVDQPGPAETVADRGAVLAGAAAGAGMAAAGELTAPRPGAAMTRNDMGMAGGPTVPPRSPGRGGHGRDGSGRRRRRSALLAAGLAVVVAAIGGTVAAVVLSGHPQNTANATPASSPASSPPKTDPASSKARPTPSDSGPATSIAPTLVGGAGPGSVTSPAAKPTPTRTKSVKPTKKPTPTPTSASPTPTDTTTPTATATASEPPDGNGNGPGHGKGPGNNRKT